MKMTGYEELMKKLDARFTKGEISEETYLELKMSYKERIKELESEKDALSAEEPQEVKENEVEAVEVTEKKERSGTMEISGVGSFSGKIFTEAFKCSGSGKIDGDLDAIETKISGACKITGDATSKEFKISGATKIGGDLHSKEAKISGSCKIGGDAKTEEFHSSGVCEIGGSLDSKSSVTLSGILNVSSDVETETFRCSGRFEIGDILRAKDIKIGLNGHSKVKEIHCDIIEVRSGARGAFFSGFFGHGGKLDVESIHAHEVYLENTTADIVNGDNVRIGPNCSIDTVESKTLSVHETSKVKNKKFIKNE
jgi:cytoskeletal protein CcmA (bactofilin family)